MYSPLIFFSLFSLIPLSCIWFSLSLFQFSFVFLGSLKRSHFWTGSGKVTRRLRTKRKGLWLQMTVLLLCQAIILSFGLAARGKNESSWKKKEKYCSSPQAKLSYSNCGAASTAHFLRLLLDGIMVCSHEPTAGLNNETCDSGFQIFLFFHCLTLYFYSFTSMPCPCF